MNKNDIQILEFYKKEVNDLLENYDLEEISFSRHDIFEILLIEYDLIKEIFKKEKTFINFNKLLFIKILIIDCINLNNELLNLYKIPNKIIDNF